MSQQVNARVFDFYITSYCTLNCKLCMTGMPFIKNRRHVPVEEINDHLTRIFNIWDNAMRLNLLGGEPLMHPDVYEVTKTALRYRDHIQEFRITTNGTIVPEDRLLELISACGRSFSFVISNYGTLSKKFSSLMERLEFYKIPYRVDTYAGDNQYFGGWVYLGDYQYIGYSEEELCRNYFDCVARKDKFLVVYEGKVFQCAYPYRFYALKNILPEKDEYIDLYDDSLTIMEKRKIANVFFTKPMKSCQYCHSYHEKESKRYPAAEQMERK